MFGTTGERLGCDELFLTTAEQMFAVSRHSHWVSFSDGVGVYGMVTLDQVIMRQQDEIYCFHSMQVTVRTISFDRR